MVLKTILVTHAVNGAAISSNDEGRLNYENCRYLENPGIDNYELKVSFTHPFFWEKFVAEFILWIAIHRGEYSWKLGCELPWHL